MLMQNAATDNILAEYTIAERQRELWIVFDNGIYFQNVSMLHVTFSSHNIIRLLITSSVERNFALEQ